MQRRGRGEVPKGGGEGNTLRKEGEGENIAPEAVSEEGGVGGDEAPSSSSYSIVCCDAEAGGLIE